MGETTGIEWTDRTYNPWMGCTKVSPGCAHCYMFSEMRRYGRDPQKVVRTQPGTFNAPLSWEKLAISSGRRFRVFTCSWSDFFHEDADPWRPEVWRIIHDTPHLVYQILSKRPERILAHLPDDWGFGGYPNVWLGTSVENGDYHHRVVDLGRVPARVHFVSAEPLLGPLFPSDGIQKQLWRYGWGNVDWVIAGGESGPAARPADPAWFRQLRDMCVAGKVPFFLKQLGGPGREKRDHDQAVLDGRTWKEVPA
jgi:protein gp37